MADVLPFGFTLFENPSDHPGHYVLRPWTMLGGKVIYSDVCLKAPVRDDVLAYFRQQMEREGRVRIDRDESDDPVIVESYI